MYSEPIDFIIPNKLRYTHYLHGQSHFDFHLHDGHEIFFLISGDVQYFVEKTNYPLQPKDMMITNLHEIHKPSFLTDKPYERICIEFFPQSIVPFQSPPFDLLDCFTNRENGTKNKLSLDSSSLHTIQNLFKKIEDIYLNHQNGWDILVLNTLIELLVLLNRHFHKTHSLPDYIDAPDNLKNVLNYLESHLDKDLSLMSLEKKFYVSRFHLCKLFKKYTGNTLHHYIIYKRIALAKKLMSENRNMADISVLCGYQNYSNFVRMFQKTVGCSPSEFKQGQQTLKLPSPYRSTK